MPGPGAHPSPCVCNHLPGRQASFSLRDAFSEYVLVRVRARGELQGPAESDVPSRKAVLENAVEKLGILASLTTDIHNDELSSMLGEEISRIIQEQRALEVSLVGFVRTLPCACASVRAPAWP